LPSSGFKFSPHGSDDSFMLDLIIWLFENLELGRGLPQVRQVFERRSRYGIDWKLAEWSTKEYGEGLVHGFALQVVAQVTTDLLQLVRRRSKEQSIGGS